MYPQPARWRSPLALLAGLFIAAAAWAGGKPFDAATFEAAQKAGKPILVAIHADWCSTCRAQDPVVSSLLQAGLVDEALR